MTRTQMFLLGCGAAIVAGGGVVALLVAALIYFALDPAGLAIAVEGPVTVALDEPFRIDVVVENRRSGETFELTDIDIAEEYLAGFVILGTDPPADSSMHVPFDNSRSFSFNRPLAAGESMRFGFELRATESGLFRGDIDVCEGNRFKTTYVQTEVRDVPAPAVEPPAGTDGGAVSESEAHSNLPHETEPAGADSATDPVGAALE